VSFGAFVLVLLVAYLGSALGPPPPSATAVALVGLAGGILFVAWAALVDRSRELRAGHGSRRS
jgi:hypothetical protein